MKSQSGSVFILISSGFLLIVGLLQTIGDSLNLPAVQKLGMASAASPLNRVFTSVNGFDGLAHRYNVSLEYKNGKRVSFDLKRFRNPNAINYPTTALATGAYLYPIAFAPVAPPTVRDKILKRSICNTSTLLKILGAERPVKHFELRIFKASESQDPSYEMEIDCGI
ncbi:MAG: hypothetical protein KDD53_07360 [Bdellovibrionales bacterium]|nr:hypothetical protein [Bdellovibrionales bacterium]